MPSAKLSDSSVSIQQVFYLIRLLYRLPNSSVLLDVSLSPPPPPPPCAGGKGLALVHMVFDNLNVRQYRLRRKGILQSLAMGFNMLELKVGLPK